MPRILSDLKKPYDLHYGDDLGFTEFRNSPVILIGGLNNSWALKVTRNLRYVLDQDDQIVDQWNRDKVWTQTVNAEDQARDDYAIISRHQVEREVSCFRSRAYGCTALVRRRNWSAILKS